MYKGTSGREQESIIGFYNKVYMVAMKSTILQFAPNKVSEPFFFIVNGSLYTNQIALSWCPQHEVTRSVPFSHCWLLCPPPLPSIFSVFPGRRIVRVKVSLPWTQHIYLARVRTRTFRSGVYILSSSYLSWVALFLSHDPTDVIFGEFHVRKILAVFTRTSFFNIT